MIVEDAQRSDSLDHGWELDHVYRCAPVALAVLDAQLRFVRLNELLAKLNGCSVEEHIGRSVRQMLPALEPLLHRVLDSGEPLLNQPLTHTIGGHNGDRHTWLSNCYPLCDPSGSIRGITVAVLDITAHAGGRFHRLLAEISTLLVNAPASNVDAQIVLSLSRVAEYLQADRLSIARFADDHTRAAITHHFDAADASASGAASAAPQQVALEMNLPSLVAAVVEGKVVVCSIAPDELAEQNPRERAYCQCHGIKSLLAVPLRIGGNTLGVMSCVWRRSYRKIDDELSGSMRLLGETFASAIERKQAGEAMAVAMADIRDLKDRLQAENVYLAEEIHLKHNFTEIIGQSASIQRVLEQVEQVAQTESTALIAGETGTGKELLARAVHARSAHRGRAMVKVNCAALPATLLESELFGREKGAYTGALTRQPGRFEIADGSTLFLDEIGELAVEVQGKLLRFLQEGQFERLGSNKTITTKVRIIAATNRDLGKAVAEGRFRADLYYRLNVFPIFVPPLRERREDIPQLVWAFVKEFGETMGKNVTSIPRATMQALERYDWPGNIRELRNVLERAMILYRGNGFAIELPQRPATSAVQHIALDDVQRAHILQVLQTTDWRIRGAGGAAEILDVKPTTLEAKMQRLGLQRPA
jgi:formate hydrogenlyase transcriptional activator